MGLSKGCEGSTGQPEWSERFEEQLEGSEGWLEEPEGQPAGSEGQPAESESQPEGGRTDGRMYGRMYGRMDGISPHSTGLRPLSGPLPCYVLRFHHIRGRARVPLTS